MPPNEAIELLRAVRDQLTSLDRRLVALTTTTQENTAAIDRQDRRTIRQRIALVGLAVLFLLSGLNYRSGRQGDCERGNDFRLNVRAQIVAVIELLDPDKPSKIAPKVDQQLARNFPPRDCSGFLP